MKLSNVLGAATLVCVAFLTHLLLNVSEEIMREPELSGQSITSGEVTTERFVGEALEDWAHRHNQALEEFQSGRQQD